MDTKDGQYENSGGWQWDGTRWVPVPPDAPAETPGEWPPTHAARQPDDFGYPDPATTDGDTMDPQTTTNLPTVHPAQSASPAQSAPPAHFGQTSAPPASSPPGPYPQQRIHTPLPPGFEPDDPSGTPVSSGPVSGGPVSGGPISSAPPTSPGPVYHGEVVSGQAVAGPVSPGPTTQNAGYVGTETGGYYSGYGEGATPSSAPPAWESGQPQSYSGSGLTAADLRWNTEPEGGSGRIWRVIGAVVAAVALLIGAAAGGYLIRDLNGEPKPPTEPAAETDTPRELQKSLAGDGFECTSAFTRPVAIDLCFKETADYSESVGFQMIDNNRAGWLRLRVESTKPARNPVKDEALRMFGSVIDRAVPKRDRKAAKSWLAANLPEDYHKNEYLEHEAGGVGLKLLPRNRQWALLWIRLNAASYRHVGEPTLDRATSQTMESHYRDDGFTCRPSEGGVKCEKQADPAALTVTYQVREGRISFVRLTATGDLKETAPVTREHAIALLGLILTGDDLNATQKWLDRAFDEQPHHTVLSGTEIRVTPVREPTGTRYDVDVNPANW